MPISTRQLALRQCLITLLVSQNTVVGTGAGPNIAAGFNNTYVGQFVGDNNGAPIADEDLTIRIADLSMDRGRVHSLLHRWYLQQLPACWRRRCCSYS